MAASVATSTSATGAKYRCEAGQPGVFVSFSDAGGGNYTPHFYDAKGKDVPGTSAPADVDTAGAKAMVEGGDLTKVLPYGKLIVYLTNNNQVIFGQFKDGNAKFFELQEDGNIKERKEFKVNPRNRPTSIIEGDLGNFGSQPFEKEFVRGFGAVGYELNERTLDSARKHGLTCFHNDTSADAGLLQKLHEYKDVDNVARAKANAAVQNTKSVVGTAVPILAGGAITTMLVGFGAKIDTTKAGGAILQAGVYMIACLAGLITGSAALHAGEKGLEGMTSWASGALTRFSEANAKHGLGTAVVNAIGQQAAPIAVR